MIETRGTIYIAPSSALRFSRTEAGNLKIVASGVLGVRDLRKHIEECARVAAELEEALRG